MSRDESQQGWHRHQDQGHTSPSSSSSDHHREEQYSPTSPQPPDSDGRIDSERGRQQDQYPNRMLFQEGSVRTSRQMSFPRTGDARQYPSISSRGQDQLQNLGLQALNRSRLGAVYSSPGGQVQNQVGGRGGGGYGGGGHSYEEGGIEQNNRGGERGGGYRGGRYGGGYGGGGNSYGVNEGGVKENVSLGGYRGVRGGGYGGGGHSYRERDGVIEENIRSGGYSGGRGSEGYGCGAYSYRDRDGGGGYGGRRSGYGVLVGGGEDSQLLDKLRRENDEIIEENIGLKWKLQEKETTEVKSQAIIHKLRDDLLALRHEKARMEDEYEREIGRVKETEKRWRFQLKKIKEQPYKEEKKKKMQVNISSETEGNDSNIRKTADLHVEASSTYISPKPSNSVKLTIRQEQIRSLELRTDLYAYEKLKLERLREQEVYWKQNNMEEVALEMKKVKQVQSNTRTKSLPAKVSVPQRTMRTRTKSSDSEWGTTGHNVDVAETFKTAFVEEGNNQLTSRTDNQIEVEPMDFEESFEIQSSQQQTLEEKYTDPDHLQQVKNLPKRETPVFEKVSGSIPPSKNSELSRLLHSSKDPERLLNLWKVLPADYENLTGKKFDVNPNIDDRRDTLDDLGTLVKSTSWMNQLTGAYNKLAAFAEEYPEFR